MLRRLCIALAVACATAPVLAAQGWIEPITPPIAGGGVAKVRGAVRVTVAGRVARVTVEEWFRNTGPGLGEGVYHYPLPGEAVFSSFSLWQGDEELRGETMDAARARGIYEAIVRAKRDPALIELVRHGLLRARVFPINPGETRKITLRYTQLLDRTGDAWRFRYVAGPADRVPRSFRLDTDTSARFADPYSPTHRVTTRREDGRVAVTLADTTWSGDLELLLPLARGLVGLSLVTHDAPGEDGHFMLLLAPGASERVRFARDVVAVMDVSGSMSGEKLEQAKAALVQLLGTLREGDRFRLVAFAGGVRRYAAGWTTLTAESRRDAGEWVRGLDTGGGTNIAGALTEAFTAPPADGSLGVVVFLTDGQPTAGETDPERIADRAERERGRFRVFAFGIGHDVNTYVLDRLAVRARGTAEYVPPGGDVERAVGSLAAKLSAPVLTDLALAADGGAELYDVEPRDLPDLFAGEELVVFGRYRARGDSLAVRVSGRRAGRDERFATAAATRGTADYVPQLWASRRAGSLSREIRLRGVNTELVNSLKELALRYGILTEYTAYLVQEPNAVVAAGRLEEAVRNRAAAPAAQTGAGAVAASSFQARGAEVAVAADAAVLERDLRARSGIAPTQRAGARLFVLRDSVWTDLRHAQQRTVTIAPYSRAYFDLLRALPELTDAARLDRVLVAGRQISIKIEAGGKTVWQDGELARIVREFR
jgi:Ca-activated chloride channel family protein